MKEAEPLVEGCPECGYWMVRVAYLVKEYCQLPQILHSERKENINGVAKNKNITWPSIDTFNVTPMKFDNLQIKHVAHCMFDLVEVKHHLIQR